MGKIIRNNIEYSSSSNSAGNISYDNSASDLNSLTVQNAITELDGLVGEKLTQYSVMPTASAEYVGKVVQFIGTTDQDYTNGYFYVCVQLGTMSSITYSWINVNITDIEFDTTPTSGSANAVTSDGVHRYTAGQKQFVNNELRGEIFNDYTGFTKNVASGYDSHAEGSQNTASGYGSHVEGNQNTASGEDSHAEGSGTTASGDYSHAEGSETTASGNYSHAEGIHNTASGFSSHAEGNRTTASGSYSHAEGNRTIASGSYSHAGGSYTTATSAASTVIGKYNVADGAGASDPKHLLIVGNGTGDNARSNILEVSGTDMNVNGDIQQNGVPLRATTMPTITASMLGKVVQYVGASDSNYKQGWNYVAVSDGAAEPTYSWQALMDTTPTSESNNPVSSDGIYAVTPFTRGAGANSAYKGNSTATGAHSLASGYGASASGTSSHALGSGARATAGGELACGLYNSPRTGDLFEVGNGVDNNNRSNIVEVNSTEMNVNGDIKRNGVNLPTPYTTMPTITEAMLGQIAMYVGTTDANYTQGWFYIASSDGAAEPTYSWVNLPTSPRTYSETVLNETPRVVGDTAPTSYILAHPYTDYDAICFVTEWADSASGATWGTRVVKTIPCSVASNVFQFLQSNADGSNQILWCEFTDTTTITKTNARGAGNYAWITKIIGIKY